MKKILRKKKLRIKPRKKYISFFSFIALLLGTLGMLTFLHKIPSTISCANSISCITDLKGNYEESAKSGEFMGQTVSAPSFRTDFTSNAILGVSDAASKRIDIDLTTQHLYAYENDHVVMDFPISSGKWGKTPTGDFTIWIKLRYTRMKGGSQELGTYYDLPNVPYTMYFYNDQVPKYQGYGIHGAYWHHNFGHPMSHGCINVDLENIEKLYNWATPVSTKYTTYATDDNPGTHVHIYGVAPNQ